MAVIGPERFVKASQIQDMWGVNLLLYGISGSGKTHLGATAQDSPYGRDVVIVDIERGTRTVTHRQDVDVFPVRADPNNPQAGWQDLMDVYTYFTTKKHNWRTFLIDSVSEAQQLCLDYVLGPKLAAGQVPGIQDFGKVKQLMVTMIRNYKALSNSRGWNVIFTALEDVDKDEATNTLIRSPALSPKTCQAICAVVDGVGRLTSDDKGVRTLSFQATNTVIAKLRQPPSARQLPLKIKNPNMVDILEHLHGGKELKAAEPEKS